LVLVIDCVCIQKTSTTCWKLEGLNGEWEVLIIRIVDEETVVDGLLKALGSIALRHQRAGFSRGKTFLDTGGLGKSFIVDFDVVDNDSPFALSVDSTQRLYICGLGGAKISLFFKSIGPLYGERSVEVSNISIQ